MDQIVGYLNQTSEKYPGRELYRGFLVGTGISQKEAFHAKLRSIPFSVEPLIFGLDIPKSIKFCPSCDRAIAYHSKICRCGIKLT